MKILFITKAKSENYLESCLLHGLVQLGHEVIDSTFLWWMSPLSDEQRLHIYGKGMTIFGTLSDRSSIDRSNLLDRIIDKEFDCIIYGNVACVDYLNVVKTQYNKNKIAFCNGDDETYYNKDLIKYGIYFKRELIDTSVLPIQFAIPKEKLITVDVQKKRDLSFLIPGNRKTYIYTNENAYYMQYAESRFGITMKKGGWDCLRHYEIIANKCLPYFIKYEECPKMTMVKWPSDLQQQANDMYLCKNFSRYDILCNAFFNYIKENLTTVDLAKYVLEKMM